MSHPDGLIAITAVSPPPSATDQWLRTRTLLLCRYVILIDRDFGHGIGVLFDNKGRQARFELLGTQLTISRMQRIENNIGMRRPRYTPKIMNARVRADALR